MKKIIIFLLALLLPLNVFTLELNSKAAIAYNLDLDKYYYEENKDAIIQGAIDKLADRLSRTKKVKEALDSII